MLVFVWMTSAYLAESCQSDRKQEQQSVLKTAKITVEVRSAWHDIRIAVETGGQTRLLWIAPCACARATAEERGTYVAVYKYYRDIFFANKETRDAQTYERGRSAVNC
jgi:hypothetical protein